ncbi:phosphodiester glycosidase family protein [Streptomyces beijiangensis]|uniref:phosphodiester glycosidase family protein n=1 Tax=Streptomyces beijiangensis TaxID=163361 RepID=UPI001F5C32A7|nr:phosphodiester glycosidase family protein [Streptomyces beijiangensis]
MLSSAHIRSGRSRHRARPVAALAVLSALTLTGTLAATAPALADNVPSVDVRPATGADILRPISAPAASAPDGGLSPDAVVDGDGIETASSSQPLAQGVTLTKFDRMESDKWLRADALSVDLGGSARVDYLSSGKVSKRETISQMVSHHDAGQGRTTVAATNADFFDINQTGAPLGFGIANGVIDHSAKAGYNASLGFGSAGDPADAAGRILNLTFDGTLTLPDGTHALDSYNAADVPAGGIGLYTPQWGEADRAQTVDGSAKVVEADIVNGTVVAVNDKAGSGAIPDGETVLIGRDTGADVLSALRPGDHVSTAYEPRTDGGSVPRTAVGGSGLLVVDGQAQNWEGRPNNATAPRTAVGFSKDGLTMHVLVVDGRQADSGGTTLTELALMMKKLGAYSALNLDGGGSSVLLAREAGHTGTVVENSPSDGTERADATGIAVTAPTGTGRIKAYDVAAATPASAAPTVDPVKGGHPDRVFPGLTRRLTATGYDAAYGPASGRPGWRTSRPDVGKVSADGVFRARRTGTTDALARSGAAHGALRMTVLGALDRITSTTRKVGLADPAASGSFGLVGLDAVGDSAPIEPGDVQLTYDHALFDITPDGSKGNFTVRAKATSGSGLVRATAGGRTTTLGVTIGLADREVASYDDAARWTFSAARATGSLAPAADGHTGTALTMSYDFSKDTATRAAYANPPQQIAVAGQPQSFTLWIKGDGKGSWPSLHLKDAAGTDQVLRGPYITWTGWKQITFTVPAGVAYPVSVFRFYIAETVATQQYTGQIAIDDLHAQLPPDVDLPAEPVVKDPLIQSAARVGHRDWRFAVMSDAQFVARAPDSDIVRQARRTLREIRAAKPDFLVINGDLVDEGSAADLKFAHQVLNEELGDAVPWYYVPGNHEVMGGSIATFTAEFGPAQRTFDHRGTRFITLDTSSLTLRGGGFAQVKEVRKQLDAAAADPAVGSVAVIEHVPPRDPTPQAGSQLNDRKEAALLENWLSDFQHRSGKGAAFIGGHVGVFHASHVDGVPYLINGNSGKNPAAPAADGGFTGWSLVGVDRGARPDWISVQTRAHVDALTLTAPATLAVGQSAQVKGDISQSGRTVPVAWPVSADWALNPGSGASFDPATGVLTPRRPGTLTVTLKVNGVSTQRTITVLPRVGVGLNG